MRIGLAILVALVFGAMLLFDTAALVLLTIDCASGGCGVEPVWIAVGAGALVAAVALSSWWSRRWPARKKAGGQAPVRRKPAGKGGGRPVKAGGPPAKSPRAKSPPAKAAAVSANASRKARAK